MKESLAIYALQRRAEIEYLKIMAMINAIISVGNQISSAVSKSEYSGGDALKKTLESLKDMLLPQSREERDRKAAKAKELLAKEVAGGPIKIKAVGKDKRNVRR